MRPALRVLPAALAALLLVAWALPATAAEQGNPAVAQAVQLAQRAKRRTIPMGPYFQTLRRESSILDAVERGRKLFNKIGCAGCHPRGGTIGGTALDVAGNRVPIPIPTLRGAALHYPRISMAGFAANIGILNDL